MSSKLCFSSGLASPLSQGCSWYLLSISSFSATSFIIGRSSPLMLTHRITRCVISWSTSSVISFLTWLSISSSWRPSLTAVMKQDTRLLSSSDPPK
ncbi:Os02g0807100 [Oryza sativa Japonica Group]|uniref:Os02g0807100 protein n=1 Tax=Oryza sativa subsp. japonica TaxID=39947 RepID=A0A0P0VRC0_ORYSJ|nr:hypothetical protein EE612_014352 [Oryza sativa]BAS81483.1 Os02g0807100 [Oryza sativa Japonica Group]